MPVRIYVLTEQSDLFVPFVYQIFNFVNDVFGKSASFPAANVRNDAIRAKVIATVRNVYPSVGITGTIRRDLFANIPVFIENFDYSFFCVDRFLQNFTELVYIVSSYYYVDERKGRGKFFSKLPLLRHTAANRYYKIPFFFFKFFVHSDIAESVLFGVFTYATGVEYDYVGIFGKFLLNIFCS